MASPLLCKCPACSKASLFRGLIQIVPKCPNCGLDLSMQDAGDGPAFIAICIIGFLIVLGAASVELLFTPPFWVHAALWGPLTLIGSLVVLRISKSYLVHWEHRLRVKDAIR